jgi:hypothetical protein
MTELVMFDSKAHFVMPTDEQLAALSDPEKLRFESIKIAHEDCAAVEKDLAAATNKVQDDLVAINDIEAHLKTFRQPTFLDLHRQTFGKGSASRHPGSR